MNAIYKTINMEYSTTQILEKFKVEFKIIEVIEQLYTPEEEEPFVFAQYVLKVCSNNEMVITAGHKVEFKYNPVIIEIIVVIDDCEDDALNREFVIFATSTPRDGSKYERIDTDDRTDRLLEYGNIQGMVEGAFESFRYGHKGDEYSSWSECKLEMCSNNEVYVKDGEIKFLHTPFKFKITAFVEQCIICGSNESLVIFSTEDNFEPPKYECPKALQLGKIKKELNEYMFHPSRIQKWIEAGNDVEEYIH
jgi:hypothetical protein